MKKIKMLGLALVAALAFAGCKNSIESDGMAVSDNQKSLVAKKVKDLKAAGLLDEFLISTSSRAADSAEFAQISNFINNTDEVLDEIQNSEYGEENMAIINSVFCGESVESFVDSFSKINQEKAYEFMEYVNSNLSGSDASCVNRSALSDDKIHFLFSTDSYSSAARGMFASDLNWSTINWYTGYCASTIAGFYMASYGGFWVRIAGCVAAAAGAGSMTAQLIIWNNCSDLGSFISSLMNKNAEAANSILKTEPGKKILLISAETSATAVACYFTPLGKTIVKTVVGYMNAIIERILEVLPSGINYTINGFEIKKIII